MIESNFRSLFFNNTTKFSLDFCLQNAKAIQFVLTNSN